MKDKTFMAKIIARMLEKVEKCLPKTNAKN